MTADKNGEASAATTTSPSSPPANPASTVPSVGNYPMTSLDSTTGEISPVRVGGGGSIRWNHHTDAIQVCPTNFCKSLIKLGTIYTYKKDFFSCKRGPYFVTTHGGICKGRSVTFVFALKIYQGNLLW
jgi:hypothetical protein